MAEYVKFRLTAAKVGVSMAFLALVAGVADRAQAASGRQAKSASANFLKLTGLGGTIAQDFSKIENKLLKLTHSLAKIEDKWLKIEQSLSRNYYKESKINATFLKITNANATFLKIGDATLKYLKIDGTSADSNKLGGIPASGFLQGKGNLLTNSVVIQGGDTASHELLGDGSVRVLIALDQASGRPAVTLENDSSASLNFTFTGGVFVGDSTDTLQPNGGKSTLLPAVQQNGTGHFDIQIFGSGGGAGKVWTATLSTLPTQNGPQVVGQLLIGLL